MKKNKQEKNNITEVTGKYKEKNFILQKIVLNFFSSIESIIPKNIGNALEVACGAGYSTKKLKKIIGEKILDASDYDPDLINLAIQQNPDINFQKESIYELNRSDNSYNLIFALEVLEHLDRPIEAIKEIHRVTNKFAIISVPREPLWRMLNFIRGKYIKNLGNTPGHINHWNIKGIKKISSNYFYIKKINTPLPWIILLLEKKQIKS